MIRGPAQDEGRPRRPQVQAHEEVAHPDKNDHDERRSQCVKFRPVPVEFTCYAARAMCVEARWFLPAERCPVMHSRSEEHTSELQSQ